MAAMIGGGRVRYRGGYRQKAANAQAEPSGVYWRGCRRQAVGCRSSSMGVWWLLRCPRSQADWFEIKESFKRRREQNNAVAVSLRLCR
jgi:hypothetical protein